MVVGRDLIFLGFVADFTFEANSGDRFTVKYRKKTNLANGAADTAALLSNATRSALYFLPYDKPSIEALPKRGFKNHKATFRQWANYQADSVIKIHVPKKNETLFKIGRLLEISYTSDKLAQSGDTGKWNLYVHKFKRPPKFYGDKKSAEFCRYWGVLDEQGKTLVTARGIIG